jgi:hypothetical protein
MVGTEFVNENTSFEPVIIIGAARSGTKFLRDVMAGHQNIAIVPYDVNYVWRSQIADDRSDELTSKDCTDKKAKAIEAQLRKISRLGHNQILVEKTVSNSLRVQYVNAVFPKAKFIHIVRDGRDVTESAMRMWKSPPNWKSIIRKVVTFPISNYSYILWFARNYVSGLIKGRSGGGVWGPRFAGIFEYASENSLASTCAMQWSKSVKKASQELSRVKNSESRVLEIRYEDFVRDERALNKVCEFVGIEDNASVLEYWRNHLKRNGKPRWTSLSEADQRDMITVADEMLREKGYIK